MQDYLIGNAFRDRGWTVLGCEVKQMEPGGNRTFCPGLIFIHSECVEYISHTMQGRILG